MCSCAQPSDSDVADTGQWCVFDTGASSEILNNRAHSRGVLPQPLKWEIPGQKVLEVTSSVSLIWSSRLLLHQ